MKDSKVLFVGDVNVDLIFGDLKYPVQDDKEVIAEKYLRTMGSSAVITAVAYSSLGGSADLCGLVGDDENGVYMLKSLDDFGIGRSMVAVDKEIPTGITVNLIFGCSRSQVTYPGTIASFRGPELNRKLANYSHIHFTGIYQQETFLKNIISTFIYLKELGIPISLDTQWDVTEKWDYLDEIYPFLDYLFVNKDEAFSISGTKNLEKSLKYFEEKTSFTLIKLGQKGVCFINNGEIKMIPAYFAKVIDTTGAGDAFAGGFLYAVYNKNFTNIEASWYASAVAARNCEYSGGVGAKSTDADINNKLLKNNKPN